jgi:hypothetical protein
MMIYRADYMKNMKSAGYILVLETGGNSSLQVAGGRLVAPPKSFSSRFPGTPEYSYVHMYVHMLFI